MHLAGEVGVAEGPVEATGGALGVDGGEDRAGLVGGVGEGGDQGAADAVALETGVDVELGDDEGAVEPVLVAVGPQVGLDDGGPPVGAVVGHPVHESGESAVLGEGPEGAGALAGHVALDDVAPDADLLLAEPEGDGLHAQGLVHPGGEVEGADTDTGRQHAVTLLRGKGVPECRAPGLLPVQNSTLMNAPTSRKPTRRYAARAAVLKSFT